tara:strand:- start:1467 stop:2261 length:795 start_codon:yes stop_codon:yes gene_type:complete
MTKQTIKKYKGKFEIKDMDNITYQDLEDHVKDLTGYIIHQWGKGSVQKNTFMNADYYNEIFREQDRYITRWYVNLDRFYDGIDSIEYFDFKPYLVKRLFESGIESFAKEIFENISEPYITTPPILALKYDVATEYIKNYLLTNGYETNFGTLEDDKKYTWQENAKTFYGRDIIETCVKILGENFGALNITTKGPFEDRIKVGTIGMMVGILAGYKYWVNINPFNISETDKVDIGAYLTPEKQLFEKVENLIWDSIEIGKIERDS